MRAPTKFIVPTAVAASFLLSACGSSSHKASSKAVAPSQPASSQSSGPVVKTASNAKLGTVLVDAQGLTLYSLSAERSGKFICTGSACLHVWHPLTVPAGSKPTGGVGSLGVVRRPDGSMQATYKGMPLYTFAQDTAPGQASGQGIKDVGTWAAVRTSAAPAGTSTAAPSSGGYGY